MTRTFNTIFAATILAISFAAPVAADPFDDAFAAYHRGDYENARRLWRPLADQGNALAQFTLGSLYYFGQGGPQDYAEAAKWLRKAADQGDSVAQTMLGIMYHAGRGVAQNYPAALNWFRKAADQGDANAQFNLGLMYKDGQGVPRNCAEAMNWFRKAADQGDANAQVNLGRMYYSGLGVPKNYAEALNWFRKAADQGDAEAQRRVGGIYSFGQGVTLDYAEALRWYRKAADQGDAEAQQRVGGIYFFGQGVPIDYAEALRWFRKAADQGDARAQLRVGGMYHDGLGAPQDYVRAYMWFSLSAAQGNQDAAKYRGITAKLMTPAQVADAQKISRDWEPRSPQVAHRDDQIAPPTKAPNQNPSSRSGVPLKADSGIFVVPVEINGTVTLNFAIDSGASDVSVPADVFSTLKRAGTVRDADLIGQRTYVLGDGSKTQSAIFTIRSLRVGNIVVENVRGSVAPSQGNLLLGQSFLERFKSWSIDNTKRELLLEPR
jgi:uncharacterized protein